MVKLESEKTCCPLPATNPCNECGLPSVLLVSPYAHYAGHHWSNTRNLAVSLAEAGAHTEIVVYEEPVGSVSEELSRRVHRVCGVGGWLWRGIRACLEGQSRSVSLLRTWETIGCIVAAIALMRRQRFDVIHFTDGTHAPVFLFALLSRRVTVYSLWGGPGGLPGGKRVSRTLRRIKEGMTALLRRLCLRSGRLVFTCETQRLLQRWRPHLSRHVYEFSYAVRPVERMPPRGEARHNLCVPADGLVFLMFGTHREGKEYRTVFEAGLRLEDPPHLLFAGRVISGNDPARLAERYRYTNVTVIDEYVSEDIAACCFRAADAAILPYETGYEKGSGVLLEACRYGCPLIAANAGHLRDFIDEYACGYLYEPGDPEQLAALMKKFVDAAATEALQTEADRAARDHSWDSAARSYIQLYRCYLMTSVS